MKIKSIVAFVLVVIVSAFVSTKVFAEPKSGPGARAGVSNIENQTKIFEGTERGKAQTEWSKGRVITAETSVQCWNENVMRGGIKPDC